MIWAGRTSELAAGRESNDAVLVRCVKLASNKSLPSMPSQTRVYVRGRRVRDIAECDSAEGPTDTFIRICAPGTQLAFYDKTGVGRMRGRQPGLQRDGDTEDTSSAEVKAGVLVTMYSSRSGATDIRIMRFSAHDGADDSGSSRGAGRESRTTQHIDWPQQSRACRPPAAASGRGTPCAGSPRSPSRW